MDIYDAVREIAVKHGLHEVTMGAVAARMGYNVSYMCRKPRFGGLAHIVDETVARAINTGDWPVIARAVQNRYPGMEIYADEAFKRHPKLADPFAAGRFSSVYSATYRLVRKHGFGITRALIAAEADTSESRVSYAYGGMSEMPGFVIPWAIRRRDVNMIARAMQYGGDVSSATIELRQQAARQLFE